ncbi:hypothetical protein SDC9_125881 [bioreactor metagenome]|uniref:Uncharacterized protein n=1 Tax=bioreactor metagenome TaxID=1076179 RepID=A0A645CP78_9ZZZZ
MQKTEAGICLFIPLLWLTAGIWYSFIFISAWDDARLIEWSRYASALLWGSRALIGICLVLLAVVHVRYGKTPVRTSEKERLSLWRRVREYFTCPPKNTKDYTAQYLLVLIFLALIGVVWSHCMLSGNPGWKSWNRYFDGTTITMQTNWFLTVIYMVHLRKIPTENSEGEHPT